MKVAAGFGCYTEKIFLKTPSVLTMEQVAKLICVPKNLKHRLILMTTYAAELRASETFNLKSKHIDSERMLIKVQNGIGELRYGDRRATLFIFTP